MGQGRSCSAKRHLGDVKDEEMFPKSVSRSRSSSSGGMKWQPPSEAEPLFWKCARDLEESKILVAARRLGLSEEA